ncbi:DNA translocase FtsK [Patescibacteria group bacterium]|nr:DNA translocase FtsK [Patescibacteria group bacterium]MBU2456626.1 DNA translocase FtsK [Patescibacteria group bacterium]
MSRKRNKKFFSHNNSPQFKLHNEAKKGVVIVLILVLAILSVFSLLGLTGSLGVYFAKGLIFLFGWSKWLVPIILLVLGFSVYYSKKYYIHLINYIGLVLFIISFQTLLHFFVPELQWKQVVSRGDGGGYIGMIFSLMFNHILDFWGSLIVLIGLFFISLILMFNIPLSALVGPESLLAKILYPVKMIFHRLFKYEEKYIEEEDDEEDQENMEKIKQNNQGVLFHQKNIKNNLETLNTAGALINVNQKEKEKNKSILKPSNIQIDLPLDLLSHKIGSPTSGDIKANSLKIQATLEHFGIMVTMGEIMVGPTVTQYTFKPAEGIKLSRITSLNNDLALSLAAHPIRIEAPIPGKSLVGIEVPNQIKAIVRLREVLETDEFKNRKNNLMLAIGKDVAGKIWLYNLEKMPHLLVAGATNSGKSVCLNSLIISLLYQNDPDDLRFIMVDPKRVELPIYNGIQHLLTPVITDVNKTINALRWCLNEMDRRFEILSKYEKKNIQTYNSAIISNKIDEVKLPYIVFIIDELADLMVTAGRDIEAGIIRLAQMARAVGIHLILATQRPTVDVITGLIKANMPARIAFSVVSGVDSKTILDSLGAEKLLGQGDMLFTTADIFKPRRLQGAFVDDKEIKNIVNYIKSKSKEANYVDAVIEQQKVRGMAGVGLSGNEDGEEGDELLEQAKEIIIKTRKASATFLQRQLSIGYARAARILDTLEQADIIGPSMGAKPREILISREQYEFMNEQAISGMSLHSKDETEAPEEYLSEENNENQEIAKSDEDDKEESDEEKNENIEKYFAK